jgi:hypothetical protein
MASAHRKALLYAPFGADIGYLTITFGGGQGKRGRNRKQKAPDAPARKGRHGKSTFAPAKKLDKAKARLYND